MKISSILYPSVFQISQFFGSGSVKDHSSTNNVLTSENTNYDDVAHSIVVAFIVLTVSMYYEAFDLRRSLNAV